MRTRSVLPLWISQLIAALLSATKEEKIQSAFGFNKVEYLGTQQKRYSTTREIKEVGAHSSERHHLEKKKKRFTVFWIQRLLFQVNLSIIFFFGALSFSQLILWTIGSWIAFQGKDLSSTLPVYQPTSYYTPPVLGNCNTQQQKRKGRRIRRKGMCVWVITGLLMTLIRCEKFLWFLFLIPYPYAWLIWCQCRKPFIFGDSVSASWLPAGSLGGRS